MSDAFPPVQTTASDQLDTIFAAIATDIGQGSSRPIDDGF
jgi:hypothetical protein